MQPAQDLTATQNPTEGTRGPLPPRLTVLVPVFDDWASAEILLERLDAVFEQHGLVGDFALIDDASLESPHDGFLAATPRRFRNVTILQLRKNLGHQRALCVGLVHLHETGVRNPVLVMDADGEDSPEDVPALLREYASHGGRKAVFAARARRTEGFVFRLFYQLYRAAHRILVGFDIRIGNFSVIPPELIDNLVVAPELWNHYAAAVVKSRFPVSRVPIARAKRFSGHSKMNFVGLVVHGLSAMSVFGDTVGVRLLLASMTLAGLLVGLLIAVVVIRFATPLAIPGWATYATGLLLVLLAQWIMLALVFTFVVLYGRAQSNFVPIRDCPVYIRQTRVVFQRHV